MGKSPPPEPRLFPGVMVSSTFKDLEQHREALIRAIDGQELKHIAMEDDSAKPDVDVIDSSLQMVKDSSAYIGVISHKYGQTPKCPDRNPDGLSLTELEFNEAQGLGRPILLFIMGDKHPVQKGDVEIDPAKIKKLEAFRERAKRMRPDSEVHRVYAVFESLEEFTAKAIQSVAALRRFLDKAAAKSAPETAELPPPPPASGKGDPIPPPPELYAEPRYLGSHKFVGRQAQLDILNDWASAADPHTVLLFDAIGGTGKSMLTWEWTTNHATRIRGGWAGRFWYSFYERGAVMADFCRCALAYITGSSIESFNKMKTPELAEKLLRHLQRRPWLFILDGLERVLVAYHRFDASDVPDEEANQPTDQIAHRDPCSAIRPEDDDLLRALAAAAPSKVLVTSRLVPRVLLNPALQPIPGVLRQPLPGLRPADAEALLRSSGITGDSETMQTYLKTHCDCHPLVTNILAGLINDYLPDRGNFDAWAADPDGGGQLNLGNLDLIQKRNHILKAAIHNLEPKSRELLSILALLSEAADYPILSALNPHLPPEPEEVETPQNPKNWWPWEKMSDTEKEEAQKRYQAALRAREEYEQAVETRRQSQEFETAPAKLRETVHDLERRGLLQYDRVTRRHDLHPVVRAVAVGDLKHEETDGYGRRVVDYFSQQTHRPYKEAETLEDVRNGLHIVRTLMKMGRFQAAVDAYRGELGNALFFNLEAPEQVLSLLRPLYSQGWTIPPATLPEHDAAYLTNEVGLALSRTGETDAASLAYSSALKLWLRNARWGYLCILLSNISNALADQNRLAKAESCLSLSLDLALLAGNEELLFLARLDLFLQYARCGRWTDAETLWDSLDPLGRDWIRSVYRPGDAEYYYATFRFWQGTLTEEHLTRAEELAKSDKNRGCVRDLYWLRGTWRLEQGEWLLAAESLSEAVSMARAVSQPDAGAETALALARFHLGRLTDPRSEAQRLANLKSLDHPTLAELWLAIGDHEQAKKHALAAYKFAWADGEPYVWRYDLNKSRVLLEKLDVEIPNLPPYDPAKREKFPWEDELAAAIEKLRAEKKAEEEEEKKEKKQQAEKNKKKRS